MEVNPDNFTQKQLQLWLAQLGHPIRGNKTQLAARLNNIPVEKRGLCPEEVSKAEEKLLMESANELLTDNEENEENVSDGGKKNGEEKQKLKDDGDKSVDNDTEFQDIDDGESEWAAVQHELDLIKKERAVLEKENALLKRRVKIQVNTEKFCENVATVSLTTLKELMPEYDGCANVHVWVSQLQSLKKAYAVDDCTLRALLITKLRGKAQQWLFTTSDYISKDIKQLLNEMEIVFANKSNLLVLRQKFEARKWQVSEDFCQYLNDKITLANPINMMEDELVEYVIDGIPDGNLRTQAHLLCLTTKDQLQRAFAKIHLKTTSRVQTRNMDLRCFNCNSVGHRAAQCLKPKREPGSCFACGKMGHRVLSCPERVKPILTLQQEHYDDYVRNISIFLVDNPNISFYAECLIDSGSPVNFIKSKCLKKRLNGIKINCENCKLNYFGLNKTKLKIFGKLNCFIKASYGKVCFEFLVVADESMGYDAVLGRDFMRKCKIKLNIDNIIECKQEENNHEPQVNAERSIYKKNVDEGETNYEQSYEKFVENINENVKLMSNDYGKLDERDDFLKEIMAIECDNSTARTLVIGNNVDMKTRLKLEQIFENYYVQPARPSEPKIKGEINLILTNPKPFHCSPRRLSYFEKEELQKLLDEYLALLYIQPSSSEYASPIVLVTKKDGGLRMCVDFRGLNKVTAKDNYPLPLIDDLIDKLGNKRLFSKLDLKNGFFHVKVHPDSVKYTSFVTPLGQFEWNNMPFGLRNAPAVFMRWVSTIFNDMIRQGKIVVYMDDILVATEETEEHLHILGEIFKRCVENKLELKLEKCEFLQSSIKYLGYNISEKGVRANRDGIKSIEAYPVPNNVQSVQSFLGLCAYFRRFVKHFSMVAKPLYDLVKKDRKFCFGEKELKTFLELKKNLVESPILAIYDPNDYTELHCDASAIGFGAILMQKKKDNKMHPVFYFSKRTTNAESKYHSFELETLAIVYALKRFRVYLQGIPFKIITDCHSLTLTLKKRELNARIARWVLEMQHYDFVLEHRAGDRMKHVDALSRITSVLVVEANTLEDNLVICQNKDKAICKIKLKLEIAEDKFYELRNGVLYRKLDKDIILFYVPSDMENQIIHKCHDEMGHGGINKTVELIKKTYWFPKLKEKVERYLRNCLKCIVFSDKHGKEEGFLNNIPKDVLPFETVHIDHYGPIENVNRANKHILVVIDAFTKFVRLYPTKTTKTKEVILALEDYFRAYSRPKRIVSDRGSCYTSFEFQEFLENNNIQHIKIATASPQANGQVERVNRSLGPMLAKLTEKEKNLHWDKVVQIVEFAMNNTVHRGIGNHPSVVLFGINQRGKVIDELKENYLDSQNLIMINLEEVRDNAHNKQIQTQNYNKSYVDKNRKQPVDYEIGDFVMIKNFESKANGPKKLIPKYKGPYRIVKKLRNYRYLLEDVENFQVTQVPYKGVWAVGNLRPWFGGNKG